jgi:hypothetical protein
LYEWFWDVGPHHARGIIMTANTKYRHPGNGGNRGVLGHGSLQDEQLQKELMRLLIAKFLKDEMDEAHYEHLKREIATTLRN